MNISLMISVPDGRTHFSTSVPLFRVAGARILLSSRQIDMIDHDVALVLRAVELMRN